MFIVLSPSLCFLIYWYSMLYPARVANGCPHRLINPATKQIFKHTRAGLELEKARAIPAARTAMQLSELFRRSGGHQCRLCRPAIGHEAKASEAQDHHCPGG